jgi:chemotaxis protein MotB
MMLNKKIIPALFIATVLLYSCGNGKKLTTANAEIEQLKATNADLTSKSADLQKQVDNLTASNKSVNEEYSKFKNDCEMTQQKLAAYRAAFMEVHNSLDEVEKKLETALEDFHDKGVDVYAKDGLVYVNMQDNLLYKSGSSTMSEDGKKALEAVASALNDYPNLKVYVVGNTDNVKFKSSNTDNLSLSTERANGVVRVLRDDYKVDPTRLVAAGKGKYAPIADNATAEGRAKNRRTEIILNPDLAKLWQSTMQN